MKIKEKLRAFGILVIRMFWPGKGKKGIQHLGILLLGIGALIGVSQAGTIQTLVSASLFGEAANSPRVGQRTSTASRNAILEKLHSSTTGTAGADTKDRTPGAPNIVDLIGESESILRGTVKELSDGFEKGVPYTEVKMQVTESLRGDFGKEYTFRQFGLLAPRKMDNGKVNLNVTPEGWAKYSRGEDVVLFLYKKASKTGLRTTAGLGQGKVVLKGGNAESQFGNAGLFENVEADKDLMNDRDQRLLATKKGAVNAESFMSFVRRSIQDKWVEGGKLRHAKK